MYETLSPFILGIALAGITCYPARSLPPRKEQMFFTVIMLFVAVTFVGFPLERGDTAGTLHELGAMVVFLIGVALSWKWKAVFLPLTYFAHGSWDLAYLLEAVETVKPLWVVQLCVPYDWLVAAYLLKRVPAWSRE